MTEHESVPEFSLFGGPLHRLGCRLGWVRGENTFGLGLVLGLMAWAVLVSLALLRGTGGLLFSFSAIGVHVRFLVAVPLFFLCETWAVPRMAEFVQGLMRSGVVPEAEGPALGAAVRRVAQLKDSWIAEAVFVVIALALPLMEPVAGVPGKTANWSSLLTDTGGRFGPVLGWYLGFCLPLFRFLILRWLWRLGLWCWFLWRVQKLKLYLVPTHSDGVGGLGYLEIVQEHLFTLAVAVAAVFSASFAEGLSDGTLPFEALYRLIPMVLLVCVVLFAGPLFIFTPKLWVCRTTGWWEYMTMASRYVHSFDRKWIRDTEATGDTQLGTPDLQSLADLTNSVNVVREMQWAPISRRFLLALVAAVLIPMLPLVLFKYPVSDVAVYLFKTMTGL